MMGAGKTSIGRRLAKRLGRVFVDADEGFVARYGRTIAEVFRSEGEPVFRTLEAELVDVLLSVPEPLVLAAGGGAVTTASVRERLTSSDALVVYLSASPRHLLARAEARVHRPLLAGPDPAEVLVRLHRERDGWYREVADVVVDLDRTVAGGPVDKRAVAAEIAGLVGG